MREFSHATQNDCIGDVGRFAMILARQPDLATAEDVRRFKVEQREAGVPLLTTKAIVSALLLHAHGRP